MSSDEHVAAAGAWGCVEWAVAHGGRLPARDFYANRLNPADQAKVMALFKRFAEEGRIKNKEKFKKVEGTKLFEFKSFQVRFLGDFRPGQRFLVAHGLRKKRDGLGRTDINTASRILQESDDNERGAR